MYCCFVGRHDASNSLNIRTFWVPVHWEAVTDLWDAHVSGDTSKAVHWEHLVVIIVLHYHAYLQQGLFVLVTCAHIVET